jgi:outer membrane protein assembly factor BamB
MSVLRKSMIVILMGVLLIGGSSVSADNNSHTSYVGRNYNPVYPTKEIKPAWSIDMDKTELDFDMWDGVIAAADGKAFFLIKGQLAATSVKTGKRIWKFGSGLKMPMVYANGNIYVNSSDGILYAVNAKTGKKRWASSRKQSNIHQLVLTADQLLTVSDHVYSYRLSDGVFQWKDDYEWNTGGQIWVAGDVVLEKHSESGAYTYDVTLGLDRKTGKQLWNLKNLGEPMGITSNTFLAQQLDTLFEKLALTTMKTIDIQTGKVIKTTEYNPDHIDPAKGDVSVGNVFVSGGKIYISYGHKVYSYPLGEDPAKAKTELYWVEGGRQDRKWATGPYADRLFFISLDDMGIYGVKTINKSTVWYTAGISNPIARFDLLGNGLYVCQTDGKLIAINVSKAQPVFQMNVPGRVFGPTLRESGMVLVQLQGKLLAFPEPTDLK